MEAAMAHPEARQQGERGAVVPLTLQGTQGAP